MAFSRQDIDVAIRWGRGAFENMHAEKIADEALIPVCSPSLFKDGQGGISHDELAGHTLLQVLNQPDWTAWLEPHGGKQVAAPKRYGKGSQYKAIEPAPGRYVKEKS